MKPDAIRRTYRPVKCVQLTARLRSDDAAEARAENMLALIGVRWCDDHPNRAAVKQAMVDVLTDYMLLDKVANGHALPYDSAVDSYRSWQAACAAIAATRGGG